MRKLILAGILFCSLQSYGQVELYQFSADYFRSNPYKGSFSGFLQHLMKDPDLSKQSSALKTDTSLFYFHAFFNKYNPFFFKPIRTEILLQETPLIYNDTLPPDTVFIYQLTAYSKGDSKGLDEVKKQFEKIHRQYKSKFFDNNYRDLQNGSVTIGAIHNYFIPFHTLAPLTVAWGKIEETQEAVLNITLRLKTENNEAVSPAPFNNPK